MAEEKTQTTADRIVELEAELEAPGQAMVGSAALLKSREVLHRWVDEMVGVVVNPALGRVTVIHEGGATASIACAELAFKMSWTGISRA